jgi:C-terminal processing protease CtpA/Prc
LVGVPPFSPNGPTLGAWYSQKTARPVDGFLGTNAFKAFRIEIDYGNSFVYFEKNAATDTTEMDLVGLAVRPLADSTYQIIGVAQKDGKLAVAGVEPGDLLLSIGKFSTRGATMGTVVDALRGKPGARRSLLLARNGKQFRIEAKVEHFL